MAVETPAAIPADTPLYEHSRLWSLSGRINRSRYILWGSVHGMVGISLLWLLLSTSAKTDMIVLMMVPMACINFIFGARRAMDMGRSWWFFGVTLLPLVGPFLMLMFLCAPGTKGPNRHGLAPAPATKQDIFLSILGCIALIVVTVQFVSSAEGQYFLRTL